MGEVKVMHICQRNCNNIDLMGLDSDCENQDAISMIWVKALLA